MAGPAADRPRGGRQEEEGSRSFVPLQQLPDQEQQQPTQPQQPHRYHPTARARSPPQSPPLLQTQNLSQQQLQQQRHQLQQQHQQLQQAERLRQEQQEQQGRHFSWTQTPIHVKPRPKFVLTSPTTATADAPPLSVAEAAAIHKATRTPPASQRSQGAPGPPDGAQELDGAHELDGQHAPQGQPPQPPQTPTDYEYREAIPPLPEMPRTPPQQPTATYSLYPKDKPSPERHGTPGAPAPAVASPPTAHHEHPALSAPYADASPDLPAHARSATTTTTTSASLPSTSPPAHTRTRTNSAGLALHKLTVPGPDSYAGRTAADAYAAASFPHAAPPIPHEHDTKHAYPSTPTTPTMSTPHAAPRTPTYDPASLTGPNVMVGGDAHRPGQIAHPGAAALEPRWGSGMCTPDAACLEAVFCPCAVYARVQHRLAQKAARREPTDLLGYDWCNGTCVVFGVACGLQGLLAAIQRVRVRRAYAIDGGLFSDCVRACCCCCCVVAQSEREVRAREQALRRHAGPAASAVPYIAPNEVMAYAPPPR